MELDYEQRGEGFVCLTVGELKQAISEIDDALPVTSVTSDAVSVSVWESATGSSGDAFVSMQSVAELSFDQWCFAVDTRAEAMGYKELIRSTGGGHWRDLYDQGARVGEAIDTILDTL